MFVVCLVCFGASIKLEGLLCMSHRYVSIH
ncbi:MAG: hypothetical protein ACI8RD_004077, partial [Bacillariaceae sp.]